MNSARGDAAILRALGLVLQRDAQNVATIEPAAPEGELVSVCAWCDWDKVQTRALLAQGKRVTHGICAFHTEQQLERARELNRQAAGCGARSASRPTIEEAA